MTYVLNIIHICPNREEEQKVEEVISSDVGFGDEEFLGSLIDGTIPSLAIVKMKLVSC